MLKTIWDTVQLLWNDSVLSKVIAQIIAPWIIAIGVAIGGAIYIYFRGWFRTIGQWFASEVIIPKWSLIAFPVLIAAAAWIASGTMQVEPRDQYIAHLREQVAERGKIIKDWRDACEPISTDYKTLEGHLAECQNTLKQWSVDGQNTIKKWQDALEGWKKQNSELQKTVNIPCAG